MNAPAPEPDEDDYPPTGLEKFKGPIAEPPGWDPETDETPDATPEADEFYIRRQLGLEAYDAARFERFHEERCADRTARQAEIKAALQAFRTGGVTPANDNLPAMARAHPIGQDAKFALSVGRGKGPRDIATARDYISGYIEDAYKALLAGDLNGACENLARRHSMVRWIQQHGAANDNRQPAGIDAETLLGMEFEPVRYVIPGFVAEGLTILGGRPKLGKSWLALDFGIAVASGGVSLGATCEPGDTIYLALEDNQRRLQDRLRLVLPPQGRPNLSRLTLHTEAPKINAGLIERLDAWRSSVTSPRLVIVDTLAMVRPPKGKNQDSYAADYDALSPLQRWASEHRLAVVVVTHVRKMEAADPLEMISGTNGLTGAADSIMVLDRTSDGNKLYGRGRDIEEVEKALRFEAGRWTVLGDIDEVKRSDERTAIIAAVASGKSTPAEIAKATGMKPENVRYLLGRMAEQGQVEKAKYGFYVLPSHPSHPSHLPSESIPPHSLTDSNCEDCEDCEGGAPNSSNFKKSRSAASLSTIPGDHP